MQKSKEIEDLRVRRTRKMIQQAFIELTVEKGFAELTVQEITERAMVNRATFYRHYQDKYDLLEQYMDEIYTLIDDEPHMGEVAGPGEDRASASGPLNLLKHIQQHADFYRVMLGTKGDSHFAQRFRQNTEQHFHSLFSLASPEPGSPPADLRVNCIAYAGVGATLWWLEQEQPCSAEQLASWMEQLSRAIAGPALKPHT